MSAPKPPVDAAAHLGVVDLARGQPAPRPARNPGTALDLGRVRDLTVEEHAVLAKVSALVRRAALSPSEAVEGLLRVVRCLDLTTLSDDDTPERVRALCARARAPLADAPAGLLAGAGAIHAAAVCVFDRFVPDAAEALAGSEVQVAAVTGGFPRPWPSLAERLSGVDKSVSAGATEVDVVVTRTHIHAERWDALYDEVRALRDAAGDALLKTILGTGEIDSLTKVARASLVCLMAGADFVKTSTGRERIGATLPAGIAIAEAIRRHADQTGYVGGLKASGGIRTAKNALLWLRLAETELGRAWSGPLGFRIGASALLDDVAAQLGRY
jgi:deoxyribose-phosphate aldolase